MFRIYKGNLPSLVHSPYPTRELAEKEVARLEKLRRDNNVQVDKHIASGKYSKGDCFRFIYQHDQWRVVEFPT